MYPRYSFGTDSWEDTKAKKDKYLVFVMLENGKEFTLLTDVKPTITDTAIIIKGDSDEFYFKLSIVVMYKITKN